MSNPAHSNENKARRFRSGLWGIVDDNKKEFGICLTLRVSKVNVLFPF